MTISELAIKRSTLVVIVFTALTMLGIMCYRMLNYDLTPKISVPVILISTQYLKGLNYILYFAITIALLFVGGEIIERLTPKKNINKEV